MVKPQSGYSSTSAIKEEKYFVGFVLNILWCHYVIYKDKDDRKVPSMSFLQKHRKTLSEIDFTFRWEKWLPQTDQA